MPGSGYLVRSAGAGLQGFSFISFVCIWIVLMVNGSFIFSQQLNTAIKISYNTSGCDPLFTNGRHF
jgi:hypothetical protein